MKSLSTTAAEVYAPRSQDTIVRFSAGNFASSAATVYIRPVNTRKPWILLEKTGTTSIKMIIPGGTQLEAYTDSGTADLTVLKECCTASE